MIHLDRQPRTSRRREAQTGSRARSGSRSERTLDAVEHSRTLMEWWPFLIFHRGGLRIKVINNNCETGRRRSPSAKRAFLAETRPSLALSIRSPPSHSTLPGCRTKQPTRKTWPSTPFPTRTSTMTRFSSRGAGGSISAFSFKVVSTISGAMSSRTPPQISESPYSRTPSFQMVTPLTGRTTASIRLVGSRVRHGRQDSWCFGNQVLVARQYNNPSAC